MMDANCWACDILPIKETAPPELPAQQMKQYQLRVVVLRAVNNQ